MTEDISDKPDMKPTEFEFVNKFTGVRHVISIFYDFGSKSYKIVDVKQMQIWDRSFDNEEQALEHVYEICSGYIKNRYVYHCD